ncbi:hypothetical protein BT96DRAFT_1005844 [Gymnopus androsaceus JB14]|uniref:Uncharacterized protein n=1 Tax=Gymnopus androsaceus JB14 TaxID=1447944 RepID=A0A6A4GMX2_9AGAR|nr:hypothetical protein BT96DRAFT_1005844 [Gymnopus androsaceus JB14]
MSTPRLRPNSKNRLSQPATKMLPYTEYGPAALGFLFLPEELDLLALDRNPHYRTLKQMESPDTDTLLTMFSIQRDMVDCLCSDISTVWPNAYICIVKPPKSRMSEYAVALANNTHPEHSKIPTAGQIIEIHKLLKCSEKKATWYTDDNNV